MTIFVLLHGGEADPGASRPRRAFIVDVAATVLDHLGIDVRPEWELDGQSLLR